jgi:hypothetical protein
VITTYQGIQGKGSAVRAIFEMGRALGAKACIILEADLTSLTRDWIQRLAAPILSGEYDLVLPNYARPLVEGGVTDIIAYPMMRMLYNVDVRQPMPGDLAVSSALAAKFHDRDVWETDVARHGIDIWMTTVAMNEHIRTCQVRLGVKMEDKREVPIAIDPTFIQIVGTIFRMMDIYHKRWPDSKPTRSIPFYATAPVPEPTRLLGAINADMLNDAFISAGRRYRRLWRAMLAPGNVEEVIELANKPRGGMHFAGELWARVVFDAAVIYSKGENDPDKVVAGLLPLYYARVATILRETGGKYEAIEKAVQEQALFFEQEKQYLVHRWHTYVPWAVDGVR